MTLPITGAGPSGGAVSNGLLNNLIAYWPGDEVAGNALDAHTNGLDLTDVATVTSNPGLVYALARQYTRANSEYHTRPGDDALLSTGDVDFTLAAWVYLDNKPGTMDILTKWQSVAGGREYALLYNQPTDRFQIAVRDVADLVSASEDADVLGSPSTTTWYMVVAWHDAANNVLAIQVNNGGVDSRAYASGVQDGAAAFRIGYRVGGALYWNGRIQSGTMWKSAAGGGGVLTAQQRTDLYNGGAGLTYASFTT